jgi:hypothetical protein
LPVKGNLDEPLLDFLRESLTRIGEEVEDLLDEIEQDDLLGVVQEDWKPEAVTWVITFETSRAVDDDLGVSKDISRGPSRRGYEDRRASKVGSSRLAFRHHLRSGRSTLLVGSSLTRVSSTRLFMACFGRNRPRTGLRAKGCYAKNTRRSGIMLSKPDAAAITISCCSGGSCSFG